MNTTANLGLKLPARDDAYNIRNFNENFEKIEEKACEIDR